MQPKPRKACEAARYLRVLVNQLGRMGKPAVVKQLTSTLEIPRPKLAMRLCCSARHGGSQPSGVLGENDPSQSRLGRTTEHASLSF
jgi:hypothetical protein